MDSTHRVLLQRLARKPEPFLTMPEADFKLVLALRRVGLITWPEGETLVRVTPAGLAAVAEDASPVPAAA